MSDKPKKEKKEKKEKKPKKQKLPKPSNKKVKVCPNCLAEIPKKAKVCPSCAAKQKGKVVLLALPLVLLLLLGAFVSLFGFHFPVTPPFELPFDIPIISGPKMSETVLGLGMELTAKQEEAVTAVLGECGFKEITKVSQVASDTETTSYAVHDVDTERFLSGTDPILVRMENESKTVQSVMFREETIYNGEEVVSQVTDYYMDMSERDIFMQEVLNKVKDRLELPEVAVFPSRSHWTFTEEEDGVLIVESYVTTKDGTGAETVRYFTARFEDASLVSLTLSEEKE